jgi:hypothetical protein
VTSLRSHHSIPPYSAQRCEAEGWLTLTEAADPSVPISMRHF